MSPVVMLCSIVLFWAVVFFVILWIIFTSLYVIPADKMLMSLFIGTYRGVYVPGTYVQSHGGLRKDARRGNVPFFRDIVILLWPFWRGVYFPRTNVVLRYHAGQVYTKDGIPVVMDSTIVFELDAHLREFIEEFNVLGRGDDLALEEKIDYPYQKNLETGTTEMRQYTSPCLARVVLDDTTDLVHEVLRKVAAGYSWEKLRSKIKDFEQKVRLELAAPESRFAKAGMLRLTQNAAGRNVDAFGPAVRDQGIDINFEDVMPADEEFRKSLSAPETGKNQGQGEGNRIQEITTRTGLSSTEVIRNETVRQVNELNVIAAGDTFSAVVGGLLVGRKPPRTGTSGTRTNP